jgi:hypothetical protein
MAAGTVVFRRCQPNGPSERFEVSETGDLANRTIEDPAFPPAIAGRR